MKVTESRLKGVYLIKPRVFEDPRGFFLEIYNRERYQDQGFKEEFVQDNYARSTRGILRGMHYQIKHGQAKLVWVPQGEVFDVVVDDVTLDPVEDTNLSLARGVVTIKWSHFTEHAAS